MDDGWIGGLVDWVDGWVDRWMGEWMTEWERNALGEGRDALPFSVV